MQDCSGVSLFTFEKTKISNKIYAGLFNEFVSLLTFENTKKNYSYLK